VVHSIIRMVEAGSNEIGKLFLSRAFLPASGSLRPVPSPTAFAVPDHELECQIGQGAYGEVWLARSVLGAKRAVKIVSRERFEHSKPFEREFRGIQRLEPISRQHDTLVDILQVGRDDKAGWFYYVMELADGMVESEQQYRARTLRAVLKQRTRLPPSEVARLGAELTDGLAFLHSNGLVHRDLKPSNILFIGGKPKLGDVGLVAPIGGEQSFVGTEGYIAPEGPGSPAADIYAMGLVLYEATTGLSRHEFPQVPAALAASDEAEDFAEMNAILLRSCASDPNQRYASATRMRDDLRALTDGRSVRRMRSLEARLRRLRNVGIVLALGGLIAATGWIWQRHQAQQAREATAREARHVDELNQKQHELRLNLYAADMNQAGEALRAGNLGRARAILDTWLPAKGDRRCPRCRLEISLFHG
jgi:hypothetical protein